MLPLILAVALSGARGPAHTTETVVLRSKTGTVRRIKTSFRMLGTKAVARV